MADASFDVIAETTPQLGNRKPSIHQSRPTIDSLRAALVAEDATYYTDDRLNQMTFNDLVYAVRSIS